MAVNGYLCYNSYTGGTIISRDVTFLESDFSLNKLLSDRGEEDNHCAEATMCIVSLKLRSDGLDMECGNGDRIL